MTIKEFIEISNFTNIIDSNYLRLYKNKHVLVGYDNHKCYVLEFDEKKIAIDSIYNMKYPIRIKCTIKSSLENNRADVTQDVVDNFINDWVTLKK